jgi:hypothetical protein
VRLDASELLWITDHPDRRGMGIDFKCPLHERCYLALWFVNPLDTGMPRCNVDGTPVADLYHRIGRTADTLTITEDIVLEGHWRGRIDSGVVVTA